jgi:hypothetical protein
LNTTSFMAPFSMSPSGHKAYYSQQVIKLAFIPTDGPDKVTRAGVNGSQLKFSMRT